MPGTQTAPRSTPSGFWVILIWSAVALIDASQTVFFVHSLGQQRMWLAIFGTELASWLPWLLATPLISALTRRYTPVRGATLTTVAIHLAAFVVISVAAEAWYAVLQMAFNPWGYAPQPTFVETWRASLPYQGLTFLIVYGLIVTITLVMDARDDMARKVTEAAQLNAELSKAQLAALRHQVEPHFMFNTLNSIAGLVRDAQNNAAVSMIVGLSEFLRRTLQDTDRSEVTLAEEIEYLQRYVDIQKVRFGERLHVTIDIPAELLGARVPMLLLQPLVENAIKHGIARRVAGGTVRVSGARHNGSLHLAVYNDGPGQSSASPMTSPGVGINNLRTRLQILHGKNAGLELRSAGADGVEAVAIVPFARP